MSKRTPPKKVHIFHSGDWDAVYFDGTLIHWHDHWTASRALSEIGIDCEVGYLPEECPKDADGDDDPPETLEGLYAAVKDHKRKALQAEIAAKRRELEALD